MTQQSAVLTGRGDNSLAGQCLSPMPAAEGVSAAEVQTARDAVMEKCRGALVEKFGVVFLGEGKVMLSLNKTLPIEFIREVQELALARDGRPAIFPQSLERWAKEEAFNTRRCQFGVDGNVKDSTGKTDAEQRAKGWNDVAPCDLVVAYAAYWLVTSGGDLFGGNVVRSSDGALAADPAGLCANTCPDADRSARANGRVIPIAASKMLPPAP